MALLQKQSAKLGVKAQASRPTPVRAAVVVRAQQSADVEVTRRAALGLVAGTAALAATASPSLAAYGDAANVFGRITNKSGFVPYAGEGYALLLPSKWNPSKEQEFTTGNRKVELRYEDNFDAVNNLVIFKEPTDKKNIDDFGAPDKLLEQLQWLFGKQSFSGQTLSEGGFAPNRVSAASLLDVSTAKDKGGRNYYKYEFLVRTADGDEGGRHQLISATVADGQLWVLKVQVGDKRWFKGAKKEAMGAFDSFTVL